jgi:phosphopantetheinyl transferase (holo-ACP synthase)
MPGDGEAVRRLAVDQWTRPVEFRRTVEAMYADGIRVFVDVGARGNLAGYVEDTLRGRAAFAVAANLPRRSGLSQLNHLVASLFAQGVRIDPAVLHARRRTRPVDLDAEPEDRVGKVPLRLGFPEMRLSESLARRLRDRPREGEPGDRGWPDVGERVSGHGPLTADSGFESFGDHPGDCPPGLGLGGLGCRRPDEPSGAGDVTTPSRRSGGADAGPQEDVEPVPAGLPAGRWSLSDDRDIDQAEWVEGSFRGPDRALSLDTSSGVRVISPGRWSQPADWEGLGAIETDRRDRDVQVSRRVLDARGDPVAENHAFGGRRLSAVDPGLKGLPVLPFTVMAEMLAEAAGRLVPGGVLVGLRSVRARRWIAYQDEPILLEFVAERDPDRPGEVRAGLYNRGPADRPEPRGDRPDVEAVAAFSARRAEPPEASPVDLGGLEPSRFTAESLYGEQWLFHGPALRGLAGVGGVSDRGIEGTLRVLPRRALRRDPDAPAPLTDPIVLDAFTHLLGCWGLDRLAEGDVIFPLGLGRLELFGEDPPEGTDVSCRIEVREVEPHRVRANAEIVRPDGRVWMRLSDWEDWRFYWPPRYRDVFRMPDRVLLAEPVALPGGPPDALAVWLQPPEDMGRPVWRDVLERVQLSPEERSGCLRPEGSDRRRTLRLWGRVAAKEAVRRLWLAEGRGAVYPADLVIEPDPAGRPVLRPRLEGGDAAMPCVSISHTDGVAVALACRDVGARIGIDVERIMARSGAFEELAFVPGERALLDGVDAADRPEWIARLWCAREAVAKATGLGMVDGPRSVEALEVDRETGVVIVRLGPALAAACPGLAGLGLEVCSSTRDGYAWAWIVRKGGER